MKNIFLLCILLFTFANATENNTQLKKMIGGMLLVGFDKTTLDNNDTFLQSLNTYNIAGVILFDKFYSDRNKTKNIANPQQLKHLTTQLQQQTNHHIFIALDQEGGKVARMKKQYGFHPAPSATDIAKKTPKETLDIYNTQAKELEQEGINLNFAPVVDLCANPKNNVIVKLKRCYSSDPIEVAFYASLMIDAQTNHHILSSAKHFPGHGSSLADSHKGFVDITNTWTPKELQPYTILINNHKLDMIMTAHVFNAKLDPSYPATLSYAINTQLLREKMGFNGVIISDDMQMEAISAHYSLKEALTLAINAGVDLLLFGNQLSSTDITTIIDTIYKQVEKGIISKERIKESYQRIQNLHTKESIIQKPIDFGKQRVSLTKAYIKKHYGMDVKDITITPRMVVVHWTAVDNFKDSFSRLYPQTLLTDRKDIAQASALNVSSHFLIDRDGTIYQLMPENWMARHVIGLNYSAIGIENVGGKDNKIEDLTPAQLDANLRLIRYLQAKYPTIEHIIGHYEYRDFENTPLWLERDAGYRTRKADPGKTFMKRLRDAL